MPDFPTIFGVALVGLVAVAAARLYLRDARDRRAGLGDDAFAWRRNSHPNVPAAPKPVLQVLPRRWGWRHLVIAAVQVAAIAGGMWLSLGEPWRNGEAVPSKMYPLAFVVWTIFVAFGTAVLTHLWGLASAALARRRAGSGQRQ